MGGWSYADAPSAHSLSRRQCVHRICERVSPMVVLPGLIQDRLAKLAEHAAHVDMNICAVAQHGLRVAPVAQRLQGQAVRMASVNW